MQQMTKIGEFIFVGEVRRVRQSGQGRSAVHRRVEDQLRPLCRLGIFKGLSFQAGGDDERGSVLDDGKGRAARLERSHPGRRVEFILDVCVAVTSAAHKSGAANNVTASMAGDNLFTTQTVLRGQHSAFVEAVADGTNGLLDLNGFGGYDSEIEIGQLRRVGGGFQLDGNFVASGNVEAVAVQRAGVLFAADVRPDLGYARQMGCIERTDRATSDDADFLHRDRYLFSIFTSFASCPPSCCLSARKMLSALLKESLIKMPCANNASCKADEMVWIGAAPPSPIPFAPL